MFGDLVGYNSTDFRQSSEEYNAQIDQAVKQILDVSNNELNFGAYMMMTCFGLFRSHTREWRGFYWPKM